MRLRSTRSIAVALAALWLCLSVVQLSAQDELLKRRVDGVLDRWVDTGQIVGAVVLIARDGQIVYHRAAGWADREQRVPMSEDAVFRLASLSKAVTTAAALALADQGKLKLDDPVTRWVPEFQPRLSGGGEAVITVRQLMTHTAGLNYGFFEPPNGPYHRAGVSDGLDHADISLEEEVRRIASAPLLFEPGAGWHYSLATDVLGLVVAKAAGASLQAVVAQTVTRPLGMRDTAFATSAASRLTAAYAPATNGAASPASDKVQPARMADPQAIQESGDSSPVVFSPSRATDRSMWPSGGGGMVGTAGDYMKLLEAIRKGGSPILKPETAHAMTTVQTGNMVAGDGAGWGFGFGFAVLKDRVAAHDPRGNGSWGWGGVYGHHFWVDPENRISLVCLTNVAFTGMAGSFADELRDAVYGK